MDTIHERSDSNWPQALEDYFTGFRRPVKVTNAYVHDYSFFQGNRLLPKLLPHVPDVVLISFGHYDAHPVVFPDTEFRARAVFGKSFLSELRLVQLSASSWDGLMRRGRRPRERRKSVA
ncbi:MAG: hypothetical protein QGG73_04515 [Candidatus Hydrogenedentes bacterium]|jgi:lysophospholipase L1-like esterase|nr:hypothetical protein [Candidatus Hydrogenedentota bacterium]